MKNKNIKKILVLGLDNSGKTSIVKSLKGVKNIHSFCSINPTIGVNLENFELLESSFNIWDFGGQLLYRAEFLKEFEKYIKEVEKIIYVIDIQDTQKYDLSLKYLDEIIKKVINLKINIDFSIFLHKNDLDIELINPDFDKSNIDNLITKIKSLIPDDFNYSLFKTAISTIFEKESIII